MAGDGGGDLRKEPGRLLGDVDLDAGGTFAKPLGGADDDASPR